MKSDLLTTYDTLNNAAEKSRMEITGFFNEVRKVIADRETLLKQKLSEQLKKSEQYLKDQEEYAKGHLKEVYAFYEEYQSANSEGDISLLQSSVPRMEQIKKATAAIQSFEFTIPFGDVNKDLELNTLWKQLMPGHKSVKENTVTATTQSAQNKYSKSGTGFNKKNTKENNA